MADRTRPHFRAGVGLVVLRAGALERQHAEPTAFEVMAFERCDHPGSWQLPQGGIDPGERDVDAAWRELAEETGLSPGTVRLMDASPDWIAQAYDAPSDGRLGQVHRWFVFEVVHDDVEPTVDQHEFGDWRWMPFEALVDEVVAFRRPAYRQLGRWLRSARSAHESRADAAGSGV